MAHRRNNNPQIEMVGLFAALNQEQRNVDITSLFEKRWQARNESFEALKRKWVESVGVPIPKKLKTSHMYPAEPESAASNTTNFEKSTEQLPEPPAKKSTTNSDIPKHPDDELDVDAMIVADLRVELRKRGLDTKGRKKELQARLLSYLEEAKAKRATERATRHCRPNTVESSKSNAFETESDKHVKFGQPKTGECEKEAQGMEHVAGGQKVVSEEANNEDSQLKPVKDDPLGESKRPAPKSAIKPSKYCNPIVTTAPQNISKATTAPTKSNVFVQNDDHTTTNTNSNSSVHSNSTAPMTKSTLLSTPNGNRTKIGVAGSAKEIMKKKFDEKQSARKAKLEEIRNQSARKAKLEEIRNKSKVATNATSNSSTLPSASEKLRGMALNSTSKTQSSHYSELRKKMAAQKAAGTATTSTKNIPEVPKPHSAMKQVAPSPLYKKPSANAPTDQKELNPAVLQSLVDPANKPRQHEQKPLSPMQTYEMSDRESESESEEESDDESERKPKKTVPLWAHKHNLMKALDKQFETSSTRLDPDEIFGEVLTCNLEEIFDKKKARYQRRTSSGNWTKDHVTSMEKLSYKKVMGFDG
mmetsp:Transcript_20187/g.40772  ORF Transcript_20187/g.40772 Transcript_20187/m.40772 type:complete len:587 (-) Transcript_20187:159-1919(-)